MFWVFPRRRKLGFLSPFLPKSIFFYLGHLTLGYVFLLFIKITVTECQKVRKTHLCRLVVERTTFTRNLIVDVLRELRDGVMANAELVLRIIHLEMRGNIAVYTEEDQHAKKIDGK